MSAAAAAGGGDVLYVPSGVYELLAKQVYATGSTARETALPPARVHGQCR